MDDFLEIVSDIAEPVVDCIQEWGSDIVDHIKEHAPQYLKYAVYSLRHIHF